MKRATHIPLVIFCSSLASLAFEVLLTRIFSISLWYHFAAMVISIAMLGFAASGTLLSLAPRLKDLANLGRYTLALGIAMPVSYLLANHIPFDPVRLLWDKTELFHIALYYLTLVVPFFITGLIIATAFAMASRQAGLLYGADLLGAGFGSLGVLLLMGVMAPERGVFLIAVLPLAAAWLAGNRVIKTTALLLIGVSLLLLFLQPDFARLRISPYKGLEAALRYPGAQHLTSYFTAFARIDTFTSPAVRFAPGLSLRYQGQLPEQIGFAVDGGDVSAITKGTNLDALGFLDLLPAALPYALHKREMVLVLDPQGGLPVLLARSQRAGQITSVEINQAVVRVIAADFREFSGNLYGEQTSTGLGRSWLARRKERFSLIDISLEGAEPAGPFGIAEDYRYTVEAFREYWGHLDADGAISINLFMLPPPRMELRFLTTLLTAMEEAGVHEPARHLAVVRSWDSLVIVVKRSPLTPDEVEAARRFAKERWFDLVYLPGITPAETNIYVKMSSNQYARAFAAILSPAERDRFVASYIFDIRPVRDENPFFYYFLRLDRLKDIYQTMGGKWQYFLQEGYILPAVLVQVLALSAILIFMPLFAGWRQRYPRNVPGKKLLTYFALLGIGFMFVEVALIQKLTLPLEHPTYAMAAVLAVLLVSSGCGSLMSHHFTGLQRPATTVGISILIVIATLLLPVCVAAVAPWPLPVKGALLFLLLAPLGFFMGIPFPTGIKLLGETASHLIPWAWVINGSLSVLAPLLAVILAMSIGFRGVLLLGALAYLLAFLNLRAFEKRK